MAIVRDGRNLLAGLLVGDGNTDLSSDNAYIWVGSGVTAHSPTDAHLITSGVGASMEDTYPITATNVLTFRSLFSTDDANFQWEEWGVKNTSATGVSLFNRKQEALGVKTTSQSWQMTVTLTLTT
jgi:hypothetical protein